MLPLFVKHDTSSPASIPIMIIILPLVCSFSYHYIFQDAEVGKGDVIILILSVLHGVITSTVLQQSLLVFVVGIMQGSMNSRPVQDIPP